MITALCLLLTAVMAVTPTPAQTLTAEMILIEVAQDGGFHRSSGPLYHGQCKRFQADSFVEAAASYMLPGAPEQALVIPLEHVPADESGRPVGTCWPLEDETGVLGYEEVARFDYNRDLTEKENKELARAFLMQVQAGDVMQMLATYGSGGRGTHTIMFTRPYDPRLERLYWSDSNFSNTLVDGIKYGYIKAYQDWAFDDVARWLSDDWNNGATLYRVRDDVVLRDEGSQGTGS